MQIKKRRRIARLSLRFTFWYSLLVSIAFGSIIFSISQRYNRQVMEEKNNVIQQKLDLIVSTLDASVQGVRSLYRMILDDATIAQLMSKAAKKPLNAEQISTLSNITRSYSKRDSTYSSVFLIFSDGKIGDTLYGRESYAFLTKSNPDYDSFQSRFANTAFSALNSFPLALSKDSKKTNLTFFGTYFDKKTYQRLGSVTINVKQPNFFNSLNPICNETFDAFAIRDNRGNYVFTYGESNVISKIPSNILPSTDNRVTINGVTYLIYTHVIDQYASWTAIGLVNYDGMAREANAASSFVAGVFAIAVLLVTLISLFIARTITVPIHKINHAMAEMEIGNWPPPVEAHTNDEIQTLVEGFNHMVESVHLLTDNMIEEQEQKKQYEVAMVRSQLDLLQSQINPHFIHNTLNTMHYMAMQAGNKELSETIVAFNSLLRSSISMDKQFITIDEEFENVRQYIALQRKRYDTTNIDLHLLVDEEASLTLIPRLILQPLVENALFHGILPVGRTGKIAVSCLLTGNQLNVTVSDNGAGIPHEKLSQMLAGNIPNPRGYNSIGLRNVKERLKLHYGELCSFVIASQLGLGTMISFTIPFST